MGICGAADAPGTDRTKRRRWVGVCVYKGCHGSVDVPSLRLPATLLLPQQLTVPVRDGADHTDLHETDSFGVEEKATVRAERRGPVAWAVDASWSPDVSWLVAPARGHPSAKVTRSPHALVCGGGTASLPVGGRRVRPSSTPAGKSGTSPPRHRNAPAAPHHDTAKQVRRGWVSRVKMRPWRGRAPNEL